MDSWHLPSPTRRSLTYCPLQWMKALWSLGPNVLMIDWWPGYLTHSLLSLIGYFKSYNIILTYNLKLYQLISKGQEEQICGKLTFGWNEKPLPTGHKRFLLSWGWLHLRWNWDSARTGLWEDTERQLRTRNATCPVHCRPPGVVNSKMESVLFCITLGGICYFYLICALYES